MATSSAPRPEPPRRRRHAGPATLRSPLVPALILAVAIAMTWGASASTAGAAPTSQSQEVDEPSAPEIPGAPAGPQLRIEIDNGRTTTTSGDTLEYTVTVVNLGRDAVAQLEISQTVPQGSVFGAADAGGDIDGDVVRWTADLAGDEAVTFHTTMTVTDTPEDLLRLATVACATEADAVGPLVCATHSDELPAGAAAKAATGSPAAPGSSGDEPGTSPPWRAIAGGSAVIAVIAAGVFLARRRHASLAPPARVSS